MKTLWALAPFVVVVGLGIQFIPNGRDHTNPPATGEVTWANDETRDLFAAACADCHSNETVWPWYARVAPMSWLVANDVAEGRDAFNVSVTSGVEDADDAAETVDDRDMPPLPYLLLHPGARLTPEERARFVAGLEATFGD